MKTIERITVLMVIIAVIGIMIFGYMRIKSMLNYYQNNTQQYLQEIPDKVISLQKRDFKNYIKESNDSLLTKITDSLNLKVRHIEKTITHRYNYSFDTTYTVLVKSEDGKEKKFVKTFDNCLKIEGRIKDTLIFFDKVEIDYIGKTVYYWKRNRRILGVPFGRKQHFAITENSCTGQTTTEEINIIKR